MIGIDGARQDVVEEFELKIFSEVDFGPGKMESVEPLHSFVAFSSVLTGLPPVESGVNSVFKHIGGNEFRIPNRNDLSQQTLFESFDGKACAINFPVTFPPEGYVVSSWESTGTFYSEEMEEYVEATGYEPQTPWEVDKAAENVVKRRRLAQLLVRRENPDLLGVHFTESEMLQHENPRFFDGDGYAEVRSIYETIDEEARKIVDSFDPDDILIFSDHGFAPLSGMVGVNERLTECGLLTPTDRQIVGYREAARSGSETLHFPFKTDDSVAVAPSTMPHVEVLDESRVEEVKDCISGMEEVREVIERDTLDGKDLLLDVGDARLKGFLSEEDEEMYGAVHREEAIVGGSATFESIEEVTDIYSEICSERKEREEEIGMGDRGGGTVERLKKLGYI